MMSQESSRKTRTDTFTDPREHALFKRYPLLGTATLTTGTVPTPYHIYDGYGLFIGGTADLAAVQRLLQPETVLPRQTVEGQAVMGIWLCDFTAASLGPHHELQFSIFVTRQPAPPLSAHPLALLGAMLTRPDLQMLCHGLWNNTPTVVAYNRELLSLNARLSTSTIADDAQQLTFAVADATSGASILHGRVATPQQVSWQASFGLLGQLGLASTLRINRQPWVTISVVNPLGVHLTQNGVAQAMTKNAVNNVRYFNQATDELTLGDTLYRDLAFRPLFAQYMGGFKFIYLQPTVSELL